jgi:hypothetical protein
VCKEKNHFFSIFLKIPKKQPTRPSKMGPTFQKITRPPFFDPRGVGKICKKRSFLTPNPNFWTSKMAKIAKKSIQDCKNMVHLQWFFARGEKKNSEKNFFKKQGSRTRVRNFVIERIEKYPFSDPFF